MLEEEVKLLLMAFIGATTSEAHVRQKHNLHVINRN